MSLPDGWTVVPLRTVAECQGGGEGDPALQGRAEGEIPFYKVSDMNAPSNRWMMTRANNYVTAGDRGLIGGEPKPARSIVFPKVGAAIHTNKKRLLSREAYVDNNVMAVWTRDEARCLPEFLYAYFLTRSLSDLAAPGPLPSITNTRVLDQVIALPPVNEQVRIAALLESARRVLEIEDSLLVTMQELEQATLSDLFSDGSRAEPWMAGDANKTLSTWGTILLGSVGRIGNGSTPKRTVPQYWEGGTHPWLTSGKIHERIITHADEFVTDDAVRECHLPTVPAGSLLVAITGQGKTLGNVAITTIDTSVSQRLAYCTIERDDVDPQFLRLYLASRYGYLRGLGQAGGSTKGALTCAGLKMVPVPKPPLDEQREIARTLLLIEEKLEYHERKRALLAELFETLLDDLMTGRRRVADLSADVAHAAA